MSWLDNIIPSIMRGKDTTHRNVVPEGLWIRCGDCENSLYRPELEKALNVCPKCGVHMRISARRRLDIFLDPPSRTELATDIGPIDALKFKDTKRYRERLSAAQKKTGETEALIVIAGQLKGIPVVAAAFDFNFLGGSMGYAVGERFTQGARHALEQKMPFIVFSATGGARMQEALISLMQMAKTASMIERMKVAGVPYISVLTDPVYGGVSASLASLGDINIAEPGVRAGFSGPNIIRETIRVELPEGFQRGEFLLSHGAIDMIVRRSEMREMIARLLSKMLNISLKSP